MRRGLRGWGVVALAAALVSCTSSAAEQPVGDPAPTTAPAASEPPVVIKDCWVPAGAANVSLTGEQAQALTARAAELGRTTRSTARLVQQLATTVSSTIAVDAGTARTVAAVSALGQPVGIVIVDESPARLRRPPVLAKIGRAHV